VSHDVFISYSHADKVIADAACAALEAQRIRCWISPRDGLPGVTYGEAIVGAIKGSRLMVLVFSNTANESPHVLREVERAVNSAIPIIPFRIEDVLPSSKLEYFISAQHWLDALTPPVESHLARLAETVGLLLTRGKPPGGGSGSDGPKPRLPPEGEGGPGEPPQRLAPDSAGDPEAPKQPPPPFVPPPRVSISPPPLDWKPGYKPRSFPSPASISPRLPDLGQSPRARRAKLFGIVAAVVLLLAAGIASLWPPPERGHIAKGYGSMKPVEESVIPTPVLQNPTPKPVEENASPNSVKRADAMPAPTPPGFLVAPFDAETAKKARSACAKQLGETAIIVGGLGMQFTLIPPGEFMMGSPKTKEDPWPDEKQHRVRITRPFYLGIYPVTQWEYELVMRKNPSWFCRTGGGKDRVAGLDTSRFPVEQVSWNYAMEFCRKFTDLEHQEERLPAGSKYTLPTEAQWEYACRAGTTTAYNVGNSITTKDANFGFDSHEPGALGRTTTVGSYRPNAWGLYDMHGNVEQWCADRHEWHYYEYSPMNDPSGPPTGDDRVLRGGSYLERPVDCRSAHHEHQSASSERPPDTSWFRELNEEDPPPRHAPGPGGPPAPAPPPTPSHDSTPAPPDLHRLFGFRVARVPSSQ